MANVAARYARALFDYGMGESAETTDALGAILAAFAGEWERSNRLRQVLLSPSIGKQKKKRFLADVFPSADERAFLSFLCVLVDKDRVRNMERINAEYRRLTLASRDSGEVLIESAYPLDDASVSRITEAFRAISGLRRLIPAVTVNDALIGGIRVRIGSKTYDGTTRSELDRLFKTMTI